MVNAIRILLFEDNKQYVESLKFYFEDSEKIYLVRFPKNSGNTCPEWLYPQMAKWVELMNLPRNKIAFSQQDQLENFNWTYPGQKDHEAKYKVKITRCATYFKAKEAHDDQDDPYHDPNYYQAEQTEQPDSYACRV